MKHLVVSLVAATDAAVATLAALAAGIRSQFAGVLTVEERDGMPGGEALAAALRQALGGAAPAAPAPVGRMALPPVPDFARDGESWTPTRRFTPGSYERYYIHDRVLTGTDGKPLLWLVGTLPADPAKRLLVNGQVAEPHTIRHGVFGTEWYPASMRAELAARIASVTGRPNPLIPAPPVVVTTPPAPAKGPRKRKA